MKRVYIVVLMLCLGIVLGAGLALAQGDVTLSLKESGLSQRPAVEFSHDSHFAKMGDEACKDCHHARHGDQVRYEPGDEEKRCADCHKVEDEGGMPGLMHAFHKKCIGCHANERKAHKESGPVACGSCHAKQK